MLNMVSIHTHVYVMRSCNTGISALSCISTGHTWGYTAPGDEFDPTKQYTRAPVLQLICHISGTLKLCPLLYMSQNYNYITYVL